MVGVVVMVGVSVCVAAGVSVGVYVGVYVAVKVAVGLGVFVHKAAAAVCIVAVRLACASGEGPQAHRRIKTRNTRRDLRCIVFEGWQIRNLNHHISTGIMKPNSSKIIHQIYQSQFDPKQTANPWISG